MAGWVCPECGIDYDTISPSDAVLAVRSYPRRFRALLVPRDDEEKQDTLIRRRPAPQTWSALEYSAHVADVFDDLADSIRRMTIEDRPRIPSQLDPDQRAIDAAYNEQERESVLQQLEASAERLADILERVDSGSWTRTAEFDWGERDALTMARNAVHEGHHHLRDIEHGLAAVRGQ
jgi:hypothetical protein